MVVDYLVLAAKSLLVVSLAVAKIHFVGFDSPLEISDQITKMSVVAFASWLNLKLILVSYNDTILYFLSIGSVDNFLSLDRNSGCSNRLLLSSCLISGSTLELRLGSTET